MNTDEILKHILDDDELLRDLGLMMWCHTIDMPDQDTDWDEVDWAPVARGGIGAVRNARFAKSMSGMTGMLPHA